LYVEPCKSIEQSSNNCKGIPRLQALAVAANSTSKSKKSLAKHMHH